MSDKHTPGRLYIRTNRHPNTDGTPWGWVDLYEPGSMLQASPDGIQVTWSRGQKSEANARRLVACWNACLGMSTAGVEIVANLGGIENKLRVTSELVRQRDELLEALKKINGMCAAPPDFSDATIQEVARTAIAKAEASK